MYEPHRLSDPPTTVSELNAFVADNQAGGLVGPTEDPEEIREDCLTQASWAGLGILVFAARVYHGIDVEEPLDQTIADFICDLMHLCDVLGEEFDDLVERGRGYYKPETQGDF